jgi:hypothetical protein
MSSAIDRLPKNAHWRSKLKKVTDLADYGEEGDVYFLQIHTVPLSSVTLTTGAPLHNGDGRKKQVHMHMKGSPPELPKIPNGVQAIVQNGYKRHIVRTVQYCRVHGEHASKVIPFPEWKRLFHSVTDVIDNMIYVHHSIKCHMDGNTNNDVLIIILYLHVCDVLNIKSCRSNNIGLPDVVIPTSMLRSLPDTIVETLTSSSSNLSKESYDFMLSEIDFFNMVYGYYGNGSFLSLRTHVPVDSTVFKDSSFFMNNEYFFNHQMGKLEELNRTEITVTDNYMFRKL